MENPRPSVRYWLTLEPLNRARPFAPVAIRLFLGTFLIYMSQDNVFSGERMEEFVTFMSAEGFPAAHVLAPISVYAQFGCGVLVLLGLLTRWAAVIMVVHFAVAIGMVHLGTPFRTFLEPLAMLSTALFLMLNGPGPLSLDRRSSRSD